MDCFSDGRWILILKAECLFAEVDSFFIKVFKQAVALLCYFELLLCFLVEVFCFLKKVLF